MFSLAMQNMMPSKGVKVTGDMAQKLATNFSESTDNQQKRRREL